VRRIFAVLFVASLIVPALPTFAAVTGVVAGGSLMLTGDEGTIRSPSS
jgi:hypothetical protein